ALSHRDRGAAGMGLYRRVAGAAEGLSRRGLAALEKEEAGKRRRPVRAWPRRDVTLARPGSRPRVRERAAHPQRTHDPAPLPASSYFGHHAATSGNTREDTEEQ